MIKEYIEQSKLNITPLQKNNVYLNEKFGKQLMKDMKVITFDNMYPTIFKQMFDNGYLPKSEEPYIKKIESWLTRKETGLDKTLSIQQFQELRTFKNSYYGNLYRRKPEYCQLLTEYINVFYTKLKEKLELDGNKDKLIYYDVDTIFIKSINKSDINGHIDIIQHIGDLEIPYNIVSVNYLYIEGLKRLIWTNPNSGIEVKGMRSRVGKYMNGGKTNAELMEDIIRREMRNDKLDKILQ